MKNRIKLLILFTFCILQSCDNFLDIQPKGIQIPKYYEDYARLLNHVKMMDADEGYINFITDDILLGEDTLTYGRLDLVAEQKMNLYQFNHGPIFSKGMSDNLWEKAYYRIYTFNTVINNALNCPDRTDAERQALVAEAKVSRAFEYLVLVNMYAKHYDATSAVTDFGVPVILSEDVNKPYVRKSVQQVYDQVFKDLKEAAPYVPEKARNRFAISMQVLNGVKARAYLYMGDYDKARTAANDALADGVTLNDLCLYSINPKANGAGRIYIAETSEKFPNIEDNKESVYTRVGTDILSLSVNVYASPDLLELYTKNLPEGAIDQRRSLFFCDDSYKMSNNTYYFKGKSIWVPYINFNCGISATELYFIVAECNARLNNADAALDLLDLIREKRILNNKPLPRTLNKEETLKVVLEERRREFAFGGSIRLIDLKRLNREEAFRKDIVHVTGTENWTLPANDARYILPVPPKVLDAYDGNFPVYER